MTIFKFPRTRWTLTVAVAALALLIAALHGSSASAGGAAQASRAKQVTIANFSFGPGKLTVTHGSRVSFSNSDGVTHTATRAGSFDTGRIRPGHSKVITFARRGVFAYHCSIHPSMHGKIVVK
jgi:plastocyanin